MIASIVGAYFEKEKDIIKWTLVAPIADEEKAERGVAKTIKSFNDVISMRKAESELISNHPQSMFYGRSMNWIDMVCAGELNQLRVIDGITENDFIFNGQKKININNERFSRLQRTITEGLIFGLTHPKLVEKNEENYNQKFELFSLEELKSFGLNIPEPFPSFEQMTSDSVAFFLEWAKQNNPYVFNNLSQ